MKSVHKSDDVVNESLKTLRNPLPSFADEETALEKGPGLTETFCCSPGLGFLHSPPLALSCSSHPANTWGLAVGVTSFGKGRAPLRRWCPDRAA